MEHPAELSFGTGIFSFPAAAKLLARRQPGLQPGTLRYWMKTGLTPLHMVRHHPDPTSYLSMTL